MYGFDFCATVFTHESSGGLLLGRFQPCTLCVLLVIKMFSKVKTAINCSVDVCLLL